MQAARRVYLYLISFISLVFVALPGAAEVLRLLVTQATSLPSSPYTSSNDYWRSEISRAGAMLIVGGLIWAIHWWLAQRSVAGTSPAAADERSSALRKLFLYGALAATLVQAAAGLWGLLYTALYMLPTPQASDWTSVVGASAALLVFGAAWLYHWWVRNRDVAPTPEAGRGATLRRWYFYLVNYTALTLVLIQAAGLAYSCWELLTAGSAIWSTGGHWLPNDVAQQVVSLIVSGGVWLWHWRAVQRQVVADPAEQRSVLRKVYLYGMTLQTVAVTLTGVGMFLYDLFRLFWGTNPLADSGGSVLTAAGRPLLMAAVYGVGWIYHWQVLGRDARLPVAGPAIHATLRQLYHYLVALVGLAVLTAGTAYTIQLLVDALLGGQDATSLGRQVWGDRVSACVVLIVVGGPTWLLSWLLMQREALAPPDAAARQALPRRLYLFVSLGAAVIALLGGATWLLYLLLNNLGTASTSWASDMSWPLAVTVTAGVVLAYQLTILLGDLRERPIAPAAMPVATPTETAARPLAIVLIGGPDAMAVGAAVAAFERAIPEGVWSDAILAPGVTPGEVRTWLVARAAAAVPTNGHSGAPLPPASPPAVPESIAV